MKHTVKLDYTMEELVPVVRILVEKYTGKESTSVTYEMAERLMGAVIFCIGEYAAAKTFSWTAGAQSAEAAAHGKIQGASESRLRNKTEKLPAQEAYEKGYQAVIQKVLRAKAIYDELIADFNWYGNMALYDTVIKGMPAFFTYYDAKFYPQDAILTLDYPVLRKLDKLCGVDIIYEYLQCIRLEQRILAGFSPDRTEKILGQYHAGYKELLINLPSVLINSVIDEMTDIKEDIKDNNIEDNEDNKKKRRLALELLIKERYDGNKEILEYLM